MINEKPYIALIVALSAILLPGYWLVAVFSIVILFFKIFEPRALNIFKNKKLLVFFLLLIMIQPLLIGAKDASFLGIPYSTESILLGVKMTMRAIMLMSAISYFQKNSGNLKLNKFWNKFGLGNFDSVLELSQRLLPNINNHLKNTYLFKRNGEKRRNIFLHPIETAAGLLAALLSDENEKEEDSDELETDVRSEKISVRW